MKTIEQDQVRASVRERYGAVAKAGAGAGCAPPAAAVLRP